MLDNGHSLVVEGRTVTLTAAERSFKSITGMVELVHGIVPMGSAQTAEFKWVSPRGVVTPVDMQLIEDQLERFADSSGHILHAKIGGATRDGAVALASKKSLANIVRHAGNLRKSTAGAQANKHASSKSAAIAKPAASKHHPAAEPPTGVEKPAAAEPPAGVEKPAAAEPSPPPPLRMVATFNNYTAELDDGSNVLVKAHDVDVYVDRQKGIQVDDMIGKFSENLLMGSHQKARYSWFNRRIQDYIDIGINSQPNLDVALDKYATGNHILFLDNITTHADLEYGLTEGNRNMPNSIRDWISPSKDKNTAKVTLTDTLKRNRKLLCKKTSPRKNASTQSRAEWLMTTKGENTRKKSTRKKTNEENTQSTTKKTTEENTP
jgi:hypothetical protein